MAFSSCSFSSKFTFRVVMLFLFLASTSIFFIARFVDQLYLQHVVVSSGQIFQRQTLESISDDKANQKSKQLDQYEELGTQIATLLREVADPEVNEAVLTKHCEEENITSQSNEEVRYSLALDRIDCFGQMLKDYKAEIVTLSDLPLMSNDKLVYNLREIILYIEQNRSPITHPRGKAREKKLERLEIHDIPVGTPLGSVPPWIIFQNRINKQALYLPEDDDVIRKLLQDLVTLPIDEIDEIPELGTQPKLLLVLADGSRALFKPKRLARDSYEDMDIYYMYEKERHTSEIAAFHLNRILGFNTVPPVAGRFVNMTEEIYPYLTDDVQEHFFHSPSGNLCFYSQCDYFCDAAHSICGNGDILEASMAAFLPDRHLADWKSVVHPWKRSYSKYNKTEWETTDDPYGYCESVRLKKPFNQDRAILNVVDAAIFDFLIGNKDRHHLYNFIDYGNTSYFILFDNGKGFGRSHDDVIDILAPLYQCCVIRFTTLRTLFTMHTSPEKKLSRLMKESLSRDVLPDILTPAHLRALDRRVRIILEQVLRCIKIRSKFQAVIIDDGYYFVRG